MNGALVIDKPSGLTSHDVVARVRRILGESSVGHLGTLDPLATGVLPLLVGRLTRLAQFFQSREKEYEGEIHFGFATDTYDSSGTPVGDKADRLPTLPDIETAVTGFRGLIQQQPPPYSAKKVGGIRAYKLARQDAALSLAPVEVEIFEFKALALEGTRLRFRVRCSSGTYVRSLAHELGVAVGVPAHLGRLRRTRVGEFDTASAFTLDELEQHRSRGDAEKCLIPASRLLPELPAVVAPLDAASKVLQGRAVNLPEFSRAPMVRIFSSDESLLAIGSRIAGTLFQPRIVFPRQR